MRLMLLEDNQRSGTLLCDRLTGAGYLVEFATTISQFHELNELATIDLYLIDLGLPDGDGLDVVEHLRKGQQQSRPILIISARSSVKDRISGLDCGADDYLCKPFHMDELLARVRALLRRPAQLQDRRINVGSLSLDCATGDFQHKGGRVCLGHHERELLALLVRRAGRLVPRSLIEDSLHGTDQAITPNATEKLVSRLRKSLRQNRVDVRLNTIRGAGYVLEVAAAGTVASEYKTA